MIREKLNITPKNLIILILLILILFFGSYFLIKKAPKIPTYPRPYRLVEEKISQSAPIKINLPPKVDKEFAKNNIKFTPEIKGKWIEEKNVLNKILDVAFAKDDSNYLLFKPDEKLKLNHHYLVELTLAGGEKIRADFLVVEDPEIVAIFPKEDSESPEDTEITIVFNRPMVPLTTLGKFESGEIPVEIIPKTEGRFKWSSTNILQFIPKERLIRSSNYRVKVKPGFVSMDGLPVEGKEIKFQTRKLRYLGITEGQIVYNQPISIYFNQPVDLEKTKNEIILINNDTQKEIPFIAEYKIKRKKEKVTQTGDIFGLSWFKNLLAQIASDIGLKIEFPQDSQDQELDQTVIEIYPKEDRFGRKKLWDFETSYTLKINKAYPLEGDIILNQQKTVYFYVTGVIRKVLAESERTEYAAPNFFDPKGKLWVSFYEEIDLEKSKISALKLKEIGYGQKCKEEGEEKINSENGACEKILDKRKIYFIFNEEEIGFEEKIEINFEKIVNLEGLVINKEPIKLAIVSYPKFKIFQTSPQNNSSNASLTKLVICSNTPILTPPQEDWPKYIKSNLDYEIQDWNNSWRVSYVYEGVVCEVGQFQTVIEYGLMPNSHYLLEINLEDVFGQKQSLSLNFETGEMPSFALNFHHLQRLYNVTTPEKTRLTFVTQNMDYINVDICKLSGEDFLYYLLNELEWFESPEVVTNCQERIKDTISLPKKYWIKNYFKFDLKNYFKNPIGNYIITFYHPNYQRKYWRREKEILLPVYERSFLTVTNLGVAEKKISPATYSWGERQPLSAEKLKELQNLYWVIDLNTLEPVPSAKIDLYQFTSNKLTLLNSIFTGEDGLASINSTSNLDAIVVSKGEDATVLIQESKFEWVEKSYSAGKIYLYTDKPIYTPGQEVFIKGIYRIGYDGNYEIYREKPIDVEVFNSKGDKIFNQDLEINEFGTFHTKLILENNAPLGTYRVCAKNRFCIYFEVLEYVPAPFKVELKTDKEEYISKETVNLEIEASYYFGVPLEGGEVEYTISSQNYYFDRYKDEYFDFDSQWYYFPPYEFGEKFILRGKTILNQEGKAKISEVLDLEKWFKEDERKSKIIVVDVTIKSTLGQTVSAQKSFLVHQGEFYLGLKADKSFVGKNEKFNLKVKSVNTKGEEIKARDIQLNVHKIKWVYSKRQEATGGYSYWWEKKKELIKSFKFDTDNRGNFITELQLDKEGEYEVEVKAKDKKGNLIWSIYEIYVWGEGEVVVRPTSGTELELETEKTDLKIGEEGKIIIKSPYSLAKALISIERGKIFNYQIKEIKSNLYQFSFPVKEEYVPNVFVSVLLISSKPEVKFGKVEFQVDREKKELEIEVKSNKKFYLPGEEVTLEIFTKDWTGKGVSAEISVAVVDLSVLALKGNPKKNPLIFFYAGFPLTVQTSSNIKHILVESRLKVPTKGGGGMAEDLALKKRGIFKETAFWEAVVRTNEEGKAEVKFTLPDNLTTWQVETVGVTKDTKVGVGYLEFITQKKLMAIPFKPRFVVPGDEFFLGAQIFNQTDKTQKIKVKFESSTLILKEKQPEQEIKIKPEKSATVYFRVQAPSQIKSGEHKFTISAISVTSPSLQDTVELSIKITPDTTYEVTASSNYTSQPTFKEYFFLPENIEKDRGDLTIKTSATLAVFLSDALNYLLQYPYGCSEQVASKLNAIAIVKRGLNIPNIGEKFKLEKIKYQEKEYTIDELVEIGLNELYNNQQFDGGFSFWRDGLSSFSLTLYVIETLNNLRQAGFKINENSLLRAVDYVYSQVTTNRDIFENKDNIILSAYTLFKLPEFKKDKILKDQIIKIVNDDLFLKEEINNTSLAYLAILLNYGFEERLKNKIYNILDNRIKIDGRGAFLEKSENFNFEYYETPIKNTALYLKAKVARKSDDPILEKVLRWLLNSKWKDGSWGSTQNTLSVIDAFTDYLEWKKETKSHFELEILVNKKKEGKFEFNPETILEQFKKEIPIRDLKFNEINTISFKKTNKNKELNAYYYDLVLKYYLPPTQIPPRDEGFSITRGFYRLDDKKNQNSLEKSNVGEVLRVHLQITVPKSRNFVIVEDFIPAGMEIVNLDLATEQKSLRLQEKELTGRELIPDFKEIHNDRVFLYFEHLEPGVYEFEYFVRPLIKGKFIHLPAQVSEMYFPENFGRTSGGYFEIE